MLAIGENSKLKGLPFGEEYGLVWGFLVTRINIRRCVVSKIMSLFGETKGSKCQKERKDRILKNSFYLDRNIL